jgi:ABC-type multidrug transport system fused ATPase/permease subunit
LPLELQRRIVNGALARTSFDALALLCLAYVAAVLLQGGLKLALNLCQSAVSEAVNRRLRLQANPAVHTTGADGVQTGNEGVEISIVAAEVEAVGGFVGTSISDPVLHGGVLLSVFGYMLILEPWMALVAFLIFLPQFFFVPLLQDAINRRTAERIKVVRTLSMDIVDKAASPAAIDEAASPAAAERVPPTPEQTYRGNVDNVYRLNMQIFRRKFGMNFLMNLLHHLGLSPFCSSAAGSSCKAAPRSARSSSSSRA